MGITCLLFQPCADVQFVPETSRAFARILHGSSIRISKCTLIPKLACTLISKLLLMVQIMPPCNSPNIHWVFLKCAPLSKTCSGPTGTDLCTIKRCSLIKNKVFSNRNNLPQRMNNNKILLTIANGFFCTVCKGTVSLLRVWYLRQIFSVHN